jgi:hypothetical protein
VPRIADRHPTASRAALFAPFVLLLLATTLVSPPVPAGASQTVFQDGFETGLTPWSSSKSIALDSTSSHGGTTSARTTTSVAWVQKVLPDPLSVTDVTLWFSLTRRSTAVNLMRVLTPAGASLVRVFLKASGALAYRNEVAGLTRTSAQTVAVGSGWHSLAVHAEVGSSGSVQVALDGVPVPGLSSTEALGSTDAGRVELGNRPTGRTYTLYFDDVTVVDAGPPIADLTEPRNVRLAGAPTATQVDIAWDPPSSGTPTSYAIYRDNRQIGTVASDTTVFSDLTVSDRTGYAYVVVACSDTACSVPSAPLAMLMPGFVPGTDAIAFAAGDIACPSIDAITPTTCRQAATSDIILQQPADAVFALGDTQYNAGTPAQYAGGYEPSWGRVKPITYPVVGNHEYITADATGYFGYFGAAAGTDPVPGVWTRDVGSWHVFGLNSNCSKTGVGCTDGTPQFEWLQARMPSEGCTVALWHHPRWSSGTVHPPAAGMAPIWDLLYAGGVDLVLTGHEHLYERLGPIGTDSAGALEPGTGIRSFVVGTGGRSAYVASTTPQPFSEAIQSGAFGVLKLSLHATGYDWSFVPEWGSSYADTGSADCH